MEKVGAREADDVVLGVLYKFVFVIFRLFVFELADAALIVTRFLVSQDELKKREEGKRNMCVYFFVSFLLLFHVKGKEIVDRLVEEMIFLDGISLMQLDCVYSCHEGDAVFISL